MANPGDLWTPAQRQAWDYVKSGQGEDMTQTGALQAYRAGGGHIRTQDWGTLWHRYDEGVAQWDRLYQFKAGDVVPESLFTVVDINYAQRYTMTFKASIRDESGNIVHSVYRQVESDRLMTMAQWQASAAETLLEDPSQYSTELISLEDVQFFEAARFLI